MVESQKLGTFKSHWRDTWFLETVSQWQNLFNSKTMRSQVSMRTFSKKKPIQFKQMSWNCGVHKKEKFVKKYLNFPFPVQRLLLHLLVVHYHLPRILPRYFWIAVKLPHKSFTYFFCSSLHFSGLRCSSQNCIKAEHFLLFVHGH